MHTPWPPLCFDVRRLWQYVYETSVMSKADQATWRHACLIIECNGAEHGGCFPTDEGVVHDPGERSLFDGDPGCESVI